jgi:hypothetical protein
VVVSLIHANVDTGREAVFLRDRSDVLKMRLLAVKSKQCANKKNKYHCPEVFLDAVADKLTTTADLFLDAELLSKFNYIVCRPDVLPLIALYLLSKHANPSVVPKRARRSPRPWPLSIRNRPLRTGRP